VMSPRRHDISPLGHIGLFQRAVLTRRCP
jgi:hypothetical protein